MTTRRLSGAYPGGYTLDSMFDALVIKPTASVGGAGVLATAPATVTNLGMVEGNGPGVRLQGGGEVINGSANHADALIEATGFSSAVEIDGSNATLRNFGSIESPMFGVSAGSRDDFSTMAVVTNGSARDTRALIEGDEEALFAGGLGTVSNFGTVLSAYGVALVGATRVTNGSEADTTALIEGGTLQGAGQGEGVLATASAIIDNFGTVEGVTGVAMFGGGILRNGSATDPTASIGGWNGVLATGEAGITNYGTIEGSLIDGVSGNNSALTLDNFGLISGARAAVVLDSGLDRLIVEAGSSLVGGAAGGGGTLELAAASGSIAGLGATATISGGQSGTVSAFGAYAFDSGTDWTLSGGGNLAVGQSLMLDGDAALNVVGGSLANAGTIAGAGTITGAIANAGVIESDGRGVLTIAGHVSGAGSAFIDGGALAFGRAFSGDVTFIKSTGTLELAKSQAYGGTISGFSSRGGDVLDLDDVGFISADEATFSGDGAHGTLTVTDGTHTASIALAGRYRGATFVAASDGHGGTIVTAVKAASAARFVSAVAALSSCDFTALPRATSLEHGEARLLASPLRQEA